MGPQLGHLPSEIWAELRAYFTVAQIFELFFLLSTIVAVYVGGHPNYINTFRTH